MENLFWTLATSYWVLGALTVLLIAALVVGYDPLLKFIPAVGLYSPIGKVVAFFAFGLLCALLNRRTADMRAEVAQLHNDLAFTQSQLGVQKAIADDKARLAAASSDAAASANLKASTYETLLLSKPVDPKKPAGCDDADAELLDVLRGIQPRRGTASGRSLGANPARLRGFGKTWPFAG